LWWWAAVVVAGGGSGGGGGFGGGGGRRRWGLGSRSVGPAALDFLFLFYENCFAESNISSHHMCNESI
jgi:hypothetical protein